MQPTVPTVRLTEAHGRTMLAVLDGFEVKDALKDAGGKFDAPTKAWLLTEDSPKHLARVAAAIRAMGGDPTLLDFIVRGGTFAEAKDITSALTGEAEHVFVRPHHTGHLGTEPDDDLMHFPVALYGYQRVGARFARSRQGSLIADEMGLGKTLQALGAAALDLRILIVCPAVVKTHWRHEATRALLCEPVVLTGGKTQFIDPDTRVVVVNYDILAKHIPMLTAWRPTTVILDEAHMVKNPKSQRTKALMGFVKAIKPRVIALTGTPIMNRPVELIPILQMTGAFKDVGKDWMTYVKTFCAAKQTQWGWDTSGASNLDTLAQRLHETIMIRRTKAEVLTDLPPKSRRILELDLEASLADYKAAEKAAADAFEGRVAQIMKDKGISAAKAIREATKEPEGAAQIAELRLQVGLAKMDAAAGVILEHLDSTGRKAVVFAHHHEVRAGLRQRFTDAGYRLTEIGGETSQRARDTAIESFQTDPKVRIFLGSTAASVGITLTAASDVFIVEQQWTPATLDQSEDRVHRLSQTADVVTAWHLIAPECAVDRHMWKTVERKRSITAHALGDADAPVAERSGGRGVSGYVAALLSQSKKRSKIIVSEDDLEDNPSDDTAT